jgi:hypothetical protein
VDLCKSDRRVGFYPSSRAVIAMQGRGNLMKLSTIEETARQILQDAPEPTVRFRLLRDVIKTLPSSNMLNNARQEALISHWVAELKNEQKEDGGWGRFHSATRTKGKIATTEAAVERGLALGLVASDSVFQATTKYLSRLLEGRIDFPDPPERNNRWETGRKLFAAATLARICPTLRILDETWDLWATIAEHTFVSGRYDSEAEIRAHQMLTGADVKDSYLVLNNRYQLALLGSRASRLPKDVENALVNWVWHRSDGVGYLYIPLAKLHSRFTAGMLDRLFTSMELLSQFPSVHKHAHNMIDWLWKQRNREGLWDFGSRASFSVYFPLSQDWRKAKKRQHDWSTRSLILLRRLFEP